MNYNITKISKVIEQIKTTLLKNESLVRLLIDENANCLTQTTDLDYTEASDRISFVPLTLDSDSYDKQMGIVIQLNRVSFDAAEIYAQYRVTVVCHNSVDLLDNKKHRLLEMVNEVIKSLQNTKYSPTTTLDISSINLIVYDHDFFGYEINCSLGDNSDIVDF